MRKIVSIDDFKKESKRRALKEKVKRTTSNVYHKTKDFCINNKDVVVPVALTLAAGTVKIGKLAMKTRKLNKEEQLKEEYCYDRSLGHYWKLRRPLTNKEWLEIDSRKRNGERLSDILSSMKVLD